MPGDLTSPGHGAPTHLTPLYAGIRPAAERPSRRAIDPVHEGTKCDIPVSAILRLHPDLRSLYLTTTPLHDVPAPRSTHPFAEAPDAGGAAVATLRQLRANQQNAARSTGPNTPEGRATCRRARLTHGLAAETLLPDEEQAEADRRAAAWGPGLGACDDYTRWLARQFAADSVRIDRLRQAEHALRARQAELAADPESWALRRRVEADALARRLRAEPQAVAPRLESTAAGCPS